MGRNNQSIKQTKKLRVISLGKKQQYWQKPDLN